MMATVIRIGLLLTLTIGGGWYAYDWWKLRSQFVFVSDARIASDIITISVTESARLEKLLVGTGDEVVEGQTLAVLDAEALRLEVQELQTRLEELQAERLRAEASRSFVKTRTEAAVQLAQAQIAVVTAQFHADDAMRQRAEAEFERTQKLLTNKVVSAQRAEEAQTLFRNASQQALKSQAAIKEASARITSARAQAAEAAVFDAEIKSIDAKRAALKTQIQRLQVRINERELKSPVTGVVGRTFVEAGEFLRTGSRVASLHEPKNVWVAANVKETEVASVQVGASVAISVDAFPDEPLNGTVSWIGPAATSQFALIPNASPSGNFTKVTQRIPLRIDLEGNSKTLRPGMMVEVAIDGG